MGHSRSVFATSRARRWPPQWPSGPPVMHRALGDGPPVGPRRGHVWRVWGRTCWIFHARVLVASAECGWEYPLCNSLDRSSLRSVFLGQHGKHHIVAKMSNMQFCSNDRPNGILLNHHCTVTSLHRPAGIASHGSKFLNTTASIALLASRLKWTSRKHHRPAGSSAPSARSPQSSWQNEPVKRFTGRHARRIQSTRSLKAVHAA